MGKLADYELKKLGQQAVDFFEDTRDILNLGKVAHVIVNSVPAWSADNGEMAFYDNVAGAAPTKRIYVRLASSWELFASINAGGSGGVPGGREGSVQYNSGGSFGGDSSIVWDATGRYLYVTSAVQIITTSRTLGALGVQGFAGQVAGSKIFEIQEGDAGGSILKGQNNGILTVGDTAGFSTVNLRVLNNGASTVQVSGENVGSPAGIQFGTGGYSFSNQGEVGFNLFAPADSLIGSVDGGTNASHARVIIASRGRSRPNFIFLQNNVQSPVNAATGNYVYENPTLYADGGSTPLLFSTNLTNQRQFIFTYPTIYQVSPGPITSVSNAATIYIQGPPVAGSNSINLINRYALWIDDGPVRIDGDLITGASTTQTKGNVFFTTTAIGVSSNNAANTTLIRGIVGTTSLVANTLSDGRTIRLQAWGYYNTPATPDTLQMRVKLGGTTVLTTGIQTPAGSVSTAGWSLNANITCQTTGGAGTVFAQGDFPHFTAPTTHVNWQMVNSSTTTLNTTGANVVEITAQWGGASSASQIFLTQAIGELLN